MKFVSFLAHVTSVNRRLRRVLVVVRKQQHVPDTVLRASREHPTELNPFSSSENDLHVRLFTAFPLRVASGGTCSNEARINPRMHHLNDNSVPLLVPFPCVSILFKPVSLIADVNVEK